MTADGIISVRLDLSTGPTRYIARHLLPLTIRCTVCKAGVGHYCTSRSGNKTKAHAPRCEMVFTLSDDEAIAALDAYGAEMRSRRKAAFPSTNR